MTGSRRRRRSVTSAALVAVVAGGALAACGSSGSAKSSSSGSSGSGGSSNLTASAPGITAKTITIGLLNDTTGVAASTFADGPAAAQARVDKANAEGGVDGRKLVLEVADTTSSPTVAQTAAQELVQTKGVFGIASDSALFFGAANYLTTAGVPVTGSTFDGPEWGNAANMFSYTPPTYTVYNGKSYGYDTVGRMLQKAGAKRVAILAFASPSAALSAKQLAKAVTQLGMTNCYLNVSVPFGGVDFTADVLQMKQQKCDGAVGTFTASSNIALAQAFKNAGMNVTQFYYTSYAQSTLDSPPATAALAGTYSEGLLAAGHSSAAQATAQFYKDLQKYDPSYHGGLPDLGASNSWNAIDVMIEGLKLAGPNPTRESFMSKLRAVKDYTLGGLAVTPVSFDYLTGNLPSTSCANFVKLEGNQFVAYPSDGSTICGNKLAYP
ncbi:MAG TPA: ABC transporter substrate-binding protein [Acidimicrobiales bacterium]|nr:ABC transporter substrate-binding protein [Acidimicrobiales bacterium]